MPIAEENDQCAVRVFDTPLPNCYYERRYLDWSVRNIIAVSATDQSGVNFVATRNLGTGEIYNVCSFEDDEVTTIAFDQSGYHLAIGTQLGWIQVYNLQNEEQICAARITVEGVRALSWWGSRLAVAGDGGQVYMIDVGRGTPIAWLRVAGDYAQNSIDFTPYSPNLLAAGSNGGHLSLLDFRTSKFAWSKCVAPGGNVGDVKCSPHRNKEIAAVTGLGDSSVYVCSLDSGRALRQKAHSTQLTRVQWSANTYELALAEGYGEGNITICDAKTLRANKKLTPRGGRVLGLVLSPDGRQLATTTEDERTRLWDVFSERKKARDASYETPRPSFARRMYESRMYTS